MASSRPRRRRARLAVTATLAGLAVLAPAAAVADPQAAVDRLERADAALTRQADQLAERLDGERAALLASRSRLDAARAAHAEAVAEMQARLRAIYRQGGTMDLGDVIVGGAGEADGRVDL